MDIQAVLAQAVRLHEAGRIDEAAALYDRILTQEPRHPDALHLRGVADLQQGRFAHALERFDAALSAKGDHAGACVNRTAALIALGRNEEAVVSADIALTLAPRSLAVFNNKAAALNALDRPAATLEATDRALALGLEDAKLHAHRAQALVALERFEDAVVACDRSIAFDPASAEVHGVRAHALTHLPETSGKLTAQARALIEKNDAVAAVAICDHGLARDSKSFDLLFMRARALHRLQRYQEAIADTDAALEIDPESADLFALRGFIFKDAKKPERAIADFEGALELNPDFPMIAGEIMHISLMHCDWDGFDERSANLLASVDAGKLAAQPFILSALPSSPAQQRKIAAQYFAKHNPSVGPPVRQARQFNAKLRIGYFSSDLHEHPVGQLLVGMLEAHDRSKFEIVAFSFGGDADSATRRRIARACDEYIDVLGKTAEEIAGLAREKQIHIAVDLNGYTAQARTAIFAAGAAPIQVNYCGYPATMGAACYHYIIGDPFVTPPEHYGGFAEHVVVMPHTYLPPTEIKGQDQTRLSSRGEFGIPDTGFVFCCFNALFKITPDVFEVWMRLLKSVEGSILWLLDGGATAQRNLRREAKKHGVPPDRLVFAQRTRGLEYLARYRVADLFLDTFHYNAHATASEALMAGLPVLTRLGRAFAGRVAAALVTAAGISEFVATDTDDYERLALRLARNPAELAGAREKLAQNRRTSALSDTRGYTRALEAAYQEMWRRYEQGVGPGHIQIAETNEVSS